MFVTWTIARATVPVSTVNSYDLTVIVSSGAIHKGLVVEGTGIPVGTLVASVKTEEAFTLNTQVSLSEDTILTFKLPSNITVTAVISQTRITIDPFV